MKSASTALVNYLNTTRQLLMADLYTITLVGGYVVRYTGADIDLVYQGNTFKKFNIARSRTRCSVGVEVDTLKVTVDALPIHLLNGASWLNAAQRGALDGASLQLQRVFMQTWGDTSLGGVLLFQGRVSDVQVGRTQAQLQVKSDLELLNTKLPRNLYQSGCLNTIYDNGCGINKASAAVSGIVTGGTLTTVGGIRVLTDAASSPGSITVGNSTGAYDVIDNRLYASATGWTDDYFTLGTIRFNSGANAGVLRSVRLFSSNVFTLQIPLVGLCQSGDSFTAWPGCNRTLDSCIGKFNNRPNFKGFPFIPSPETVL
ncbi:DUF2163 domain-containing protein [Undibacterium sp. RTI2.1]|uniref:DUF2163 domain-containing protein n=1 Tax=unclassified Undibacterium TaxID=2630295 RepID=UPI002AB55B7C|nr:MULTISPECIES: DUF2163 domain-containing protein [unclassified Undibacterium]MDY7537681.1 DUF2163 domain-containing protein [Undibacterium sp. 5I1]MEB0029283.1 DUF2163 domain-containing protein [Undibacterium sp. RTI2.1]MEB0115591.1 DUF2163 domain-containing protein [Undibacterium sp. RTI2.2]MEB0256418.1 DUF2163 domain-containing protein [Undibacterium sp. 5I1]